MMIILALVFLPNVVIYRLISALRKCIQLAPRYQKALTMVKIHSGKQWDKRTAISKALTYVGAINKVH